MSVLFVSDQIALVAEPPETVEEARERLYRLRDLGALAVVRAKAFDDLAAAAFDSGRPLSALDRYERDEVRRFFARVIQGVDGHLYWDGPLEKGFRQNNGTDRNPRRWLVERERGIELPRTTDVWPICGEKNCVAAAHQEVGRSPSRRLFPNERIIGALQVVALRLGRSPTYREWLEGDYRPTNKVIVGRFGSWNKALESAGLKTRRGDFAPTERETAIRGLHALAEASGRPPMTADVRRNREWLRAMGFPIDSRTFARAIVGARRAPWPRVLEAAFEEDEPR